MTATDDHPDHAPTAPPKPAHLLAGAVRHSAGRTAAVFACSVGSAGVAIALPAVLGHTLDLLLEHGAGLRVAVTVCAILIVVEIACTALEALLGGIITARSAAWLRRLGIDHLLSVAPHRAAEHGPPGDLVTRLTGNVAEASTAPTTAATGLAALLVPLGGLIALAVIDVWLVAAFLAGVPLLIWLLRSFARGSSDSVTRYQRVQGEIAGRLVEALGGARSIAAAGGTNHELDRILAPLPRLAEQGRRMWLVYGRAMAGAGILVPMLSTAVLAVGGVRLAAGDLTVGELLAASRYTALAAGLGVAVGGLDSLIRSRAAARRTAVLLGIPALRSGSRALPAAGPGRLELRGVTVLRGGAAVLRGVDLVVPGGGTTAVVGLSGAGKSTLAAVAGRLTDADAGVVLLDGVPLTEIDPAQLRCEVGYAFERPALFGDTIADGIGFGPYRPAPDRIEAAASAAGADTFIRLLPAGYAAPRADAPLSGGELQRLGLARAFAHAGRLLVLDDATSSLDSVTELRVGRALAHEVRTGTRLLIAHRVSSAARADLVAWLENGRVRAVGTHETLWEQAEYRAVFADGDAAEGGGGEETGGADPGPGNGTDRRAGRADPIPAGRVGHEPAETEPGSRDRADRPAVCAIPDPTGRVGHEAARVAPGPAGPVGRRPLDAEPGSASTVGRTAMPAEPGTDGRADHQAECVAPGPAGPVGRRPLEAEPGPASTVGRTAMPAEPGTDGRADHRAGQAQSGAPGRVGRPAGGSVDSSGVGR
ncbi:ABC transporter transmembrane domain-containing protein [Embleya sp. AB8]|uniref:ABC transporter ATP-binding protein n=1 Tax=Embleya sp. AB8 TaxID=3156304 RepID=UPI003C770818